MRGLRYLSSKAFGGDSSAVYERIFKLGSPVWSTFVDMTIKGCPQCIESPRRILDVASGPGEPGLSIARRMPNAQITVVDKEESMIEIAKRRSAQVDNVQCVVASAENLSEFADNSFDLVTCNFGLMFFPDQKKALREMKRVLRPGCELLISHWQDIPLTRVAKSILKACDITEPISADPESLAKPGATEALLNSAGFDVAEAVEKSLPFSFPNSQNAYEAATLIIRTILADHQADQKARDFFDNSLLFSSSSPTPPEGTPYFLLHDDKSLSLHPKNSYIVTVAIKPPF